MLNRILLFSVSFNKKGEMGQGQGQGTKVPPPRPPPPSRPAPPAPSQAGMYQFVGRIKIMN